MNVELEKVFVEETKKAKHENEFGIRNGNWIAWVALKLIDKERNAPIPEWFYLMVCPPQYLKQPLDKSPQYNEKYFIVQDQFNLDEVNAIAKERFGRIKVNNWDDFYEQMSQVFLYEDAPD